MQEIVHRFFVAYGFNFYFHTPRCMYRVDVCFKLCFGNTRVYVNRAAPKIKLLAANQEV